MPTRGGLGIRDGFRVADDIRRQQGTYPVGERRISGMHFTVESEMRDLNRRTWIGLAAVMVVTVVVLAACGPSGTNETPEEDREEEPAPPTPESQEVGVYSVDPSRSVLSFAMVSAPSDADPLAFALAESDPGILQSHSLGDDGVLVLHIDPAWMPASDLEEILFTYALVNAGAPFSEGGHVLVFRGEGNEAPMYDGVHLVADPFLLEAGWEDEWVAASEGLRREALDSLPTYFTPIGWGDEESLVGIDGDHLATHDVASSTTHRWGITAWSAILSPDGDHVAFIDESGVHLVARSDPGAPVSVHPSSGMDDGGMWQLAGFSPAGDRLLYARVFEWDSEYYVFDLEAGERERLHTSLEGYFLTHGGTWSSETEILFNVRAVARKGGTAEYGFGARGDLARYYLADESYALITDVEDGCFVTAEGYIAPGEVAYREDCPDAPPRVGTYRTDLAEKDMYPPAAAAIIPGPGGDATVLVSEMVRMPYRSHLRLFVYGASGEVGSLRLGGASNSARVFWAPGGDRFTVTADFRAPDEGDAGAGEHRLTFLVTLPG